MDVESRETIDEAIDRAKAAIGVAGAALITSIQQAGVQLSDRMISQISNVVQGALLGLTATEDKAMADLRGLLNALDGWTLTVTLNKPKDKA